MMSAILPVRNGAAFIEEALASVLDQPEVSEIIVVDDGSSDDSAARAAGFAKVRVLRQEPRGPGAARNAGVLEARRSLLAFIDADDVWLPAKSALQLDKLSPTSRAYSVTAFELFVQPGELLPPSARLEHLGVERAPLLSSLVLRRDLFLEVGGFDERLTTAEDVDWFLRAGAAGLGRELVNRVLLRKRLHASNTSLRVPGNTGRLLDVLRRHVGNNPDSRRG